MCVLHFFKMSAVLHWADYLALAFYFILVVGFGVWTFIPKTNRESVNGYFLASKTMNFIPVGASLFASNIGSGHLIGLAGGGAISGVGIVGFEASAPFVLVLLGWVFLPVYIRAGVVTMPEYLYKRFGGDRIRVYLSVLSLLLYIATKISADLFSGALFLKITFDLDLYMSIGILIVIAAIFSIGGGIAAVIWTDFIQTVIMLVGAIYLAIKSFMAVGGFNSFMARYPYAVDTKAIFSNATCGIPSKNVFNMIRPIDSDYPWTGMTFGVLINSVWYWCSDQVIVQRALAAKNIVHAKAGCVLCAFLKFLPIFIIIFPGMVSRVLFTNEVACSTPESCLEKCGSEYGCSNSAYPRMVIDLMPIGARGLMLAVMMAALMSSLTSVFNSSSAIFTMDIWKRLRTNAKEWELIVVGRLFVVLLVFISILWIPIVEAAQGSKLFDYIQSYMSYLAPPVSAVYLMAIFFNRINEKGAFWGLTVGLIVGLSRAFWELSYSVPPCARKQLDNRPAILTKVHYLHFRFILFFITIFVSWVVSLMTKPIPDIHLQRLTYSTLYSPNEPVPIPRGKKFNWFRKQNKNTTTDIELPVQNEVLLNKEKQQNVETELDRKNITKIKKVLYFISGIKTSTIEKQNQQINTEKKMDTTIDEDPFWSKFCDIGAVVSMALSGFLFAFFNKFN